MKKVYTVVTAQPMDWWYTAQDALEAAQGIEHSPPRTELLAMLAALLKHMGSLEELSKDPVVIWIPDGNYLVTTLLAKIVDNGMTFWMVPQEFSPMLLGLGFEDLQDYRTITLDL
jgi:hypothetical protein